LAVPLAALSLWVNSVTWKLCVRYRAPVSAAFQAGGFWLSGYTRCAWVPGKAC